MANENSSVNRPKRKNSRCFCGISYLDPSSLSFIFDINSHIIHYCYVVHDKDTDVEGNFKQSHIHFVAVLDIPVTNVTFQRIFSSALNSDGIPQNTLTQICTDKSSYCVYMTHNDEDDDHKVVYEISQFIMDDRDYWNKYFHLDFDDDSKDISVAILDSMERGIPLNEMYRLYGNAFIYHYSQYVSVFCDIHDIDKSYFSVYYRKINKK